MTARALARYGVIVALLLLALCGALRYDRFLTAYTPAPQESAFSPCQTARRRFYRDHDPSRLPRP